MTESESFIHEVSEEVRKDRLYAFLRKWGWAIGVTILLIVGGAGYNEWRDHKARTDAESAGDALRAAMAVEEPSARAAALSDLATEGNAAALISAFAQSGSRLESGNTEEAGAALAGAADGSGAGEPYQALASLQRVSLLGAGLDASERMAALDLLSRPGAPFRPLALEQMALLHLESGDKEAAVASLEEILVAPQATEALTARARQLIIAVGGALPLSGGTGAALPADG